MSLHPYSSEWDLIQYFWTIVKGKIGEVELKSFILTYLLVVFMACLFTVKYQIINSILTYSKNNMLVWKKLSYIFWKR